MSRWSRLVALGTTRIDARILTITAFGPFDRDPLWVSPRLGLTMVDQHSGGAARRRY